MRSFLVSAAIAFIFVLSLIHQLDAHDIPKQRVDRTIQLTFEPARLRLEYSLELDDTTIAADLRRLRPGALPPDPEEWLNAYGKLVAELLPKAFRLTGPDQLSINDWKTVSIERIREQHTVYEFTYEIGLPLKGNWKFADQNYQSSDGLSRLGVKSAGGVSLNSFANYPELAKNKAYEPIWMLDEKAQKQTTSWQGELSWNGNDPPNFPTETKSDIISEPTDNTRFTIIGAFLLGLWHTLQPGHGKSWLMASAMLRTKGIFESFRVITGWALSHFMVLFLMAVVALFFPVTATTQLSNSLRLLAALLIACPAAERLGRLFAENTTEAKMNKANQLSNSPNSFRLGMIAGIVPCWEAIGLLLLGLSAGYPLQGLILVLSFVSGSLLVMIMLILFADFILRYFTIGGFLGYIFNMAMNLIVLAAGLRLLWQSGSTG
jgi:ABC-type nickel/cobalt efflux system permease component RcnA